MTTELDKERSKHADAHTLAQLEDRIAEINNKLREKGHVDEPKSAKDEANKKTGGHGAGAGAAGGSGSGVGGNKAAVGVRGGLAVDVADKEESWKLGKLSLDEVSPLSFTVFYYLLWLWCMCVMLC